jgi:hypothetical protein
MSIFKKILKGIGKVIKPVALIAGSVLGIGAVAGAVKGVGALGGIVKTALGIKKTVGKISQSAVNLVSGTTVQERAQVKEIKKEAKAEQDKLEQVDRLIKAGATRAKAEQMLGITAQEMGSANAAEKDAETQARLQTETINTGSQTAGKGCLITSILIISALAGMAFTIIML